MAHLSGTFAHNQPGKLLVTFRATWYNSSYRDAGFPTGDQTANLLLRAFVGPNDGTRKYTEPLDKNLAVAYLVMDYPGGNASWPVGTEEVAHQSPTTGIWSYALAKLSLELKLI